MGWLKRAWSAWVSTLSSYYSVLDPRRKHRPSLPPAASASRVVASSLPDLIRWCRQVERDTPLGRAAVDGLVADIVGSGIDVSPREADEATNHDIARLWSQYVERVTVTGETLWQWQRMVVRDLATSGAALARIVVDEEADGIPIRVVPLEVEWLSSDSLRSVPAGRVFMRGIEFDALGRPRAYHLRHPDGGSGGEVVPAEQVIYIHVPRRAGHRLGEPLLAPVVSRCDQDGRLIEAELRAAVVSAAPTVVLLTEGRVPRRQDESDDTPMEIPAGSVVRLRPGEKVESIESHRPNQRIHDFRAGLRGDIAAAVGVSQYWLDRDPSRANYSSMRMDFLAAKRSAIELQEIVGRGTAGRLYEEALRYIAILLGGVELVGEYELQPDSWEYVDPRKDAEAAILAIDAGLSTYERELASRGRDWRAVLRQRAAEQRYIEELGVPIRHENGGKEDAVSE